MNRYEWRDVAEPSFRQPIDDPGTSPIVGPFVCIAINAEWRSILAGCALQVAQPASWTETDPVLLENLLGRATELVEAIATSGACVQSGTVSVTITASHGTGTAAVTFPQAYATAAVVIVSSSNGNLIASYEDVTTTGFTARLTASVELTGTFATDVSWIVQGS